MEPRADDPQSDDGALAKALEVIANPVRLSLLHRLGRPAFMPDLTNEFDMTRQALKKHLDALEAVGLVVAKPSRRGALRATEYLTDPTGLFALKENVRGLAVTADPSSLPPAATLRAGSGEKPRATRGIGLLLVHGDSPGRWFDLHGRPSSILGRDPKADIPLSYDPFASARHAMLRLGGDGWTLTDLHATNGTRVNFRSIPHGGTVDIANGDLITIGKSHLLMRDGL